MTRLCRQNFAPHAFRPPGIPDQREWPAKSTHRSSGKYSRPGTIGCSSGFLEGSMRVCIVPEFPAGLMSGGTLVQAEETCEALAATGDGLTAELFNWSEYRSLPDLYHFVSIQPHFYPILELIRQIGRPYLLTLLSPNPAGGPRLWVSAARHFVKVKCLRRVELYRAIHGASAIIAITRSGADSLRTIFRHGTKTLHVVPHGVREGFFSCSPDAWKATFGPEPFVLCVGAIQRRKNQLLLVEACNRLRLPVVLLGHVLPGEKD